jgi:hypothetical protein
MTVNATAKAPVAAPKAGLKPVPPPAPPKATVLNAQVEAFTRWIGKSVRIERLHGRDPIIGTLATFDQYVLVVKVGDTVTVVYKHGIGSVCLFIERDAE